MRASVVDAASAIANRTLATMILFERRLRVLHALLLSAVLFGTFMQRDLAAQTPPAVATAQANTGPIIADPPGVNFGIVEPGVTVSATIKLINPLDRPVTIKIAQPSCTCTSVDVTGKVIPAKGMLEMPMSMKTPHSVGPKTAQVQLVFEGFNQVLKVRIDAETAYAVRANPAFIDALAPERMKGFFELSAADGTPFMVLSVAGKPALTADGKPMVAAARQVVRYDFTPSASAKVPPFLIVETDHPKCPVLDLRVRHETTRIAPALNFAEYRENVGLSAKGASSEFEIEIKHMAAARVSGVTSLNPAAKTELLEQRSDGDSLMVKVRFTNVSLPNGVFLFPCQFTSGAKAADLWLYGTVRAAATSTTPLTLDLRIDEKKLTTLAPFAHDGSVRSAPPIAVLRIATRATDLAMTEETYNAARLAIDRGLAELARTQSANGKWFEGTEVTPTDMQPRQRAASVAVTAMALKAFAQLGEASDARAQLQAKSAILAVLSSAAETDAVVNGGLGNYVMSAIASGLATVGDADATAATTRAIAWLRENQWDDAEGIDPSKDWFGGAGYGNSKRPDLSNTQMMLDAMHDAGVSHDDPAFERAVAFISRTQNRSATNPAKWAENGANDGGFVYTPANGGESFASDAAGEGRFGEKMTTKSLRSYGSMTYAGFKSLLYAGLSPADPRVQDALEWIGAHFTFLENPGLGQQGYFYYIHAMSRALQASGLASIHDNTGRSHEWRSELINALVTRQRANGSWKNESDRWEESNETLATIYAVLALEEALKPAPSLK